MLSDLPHSPDLHDALGALLRLYAEWGVDSALDPAPLDRATGISGAELMPAAPARQRASSAGPRMEPEAARETGPGSAARPAPVSRVPTGVAVEPAADLETLISRLKTVPDIALRRTATHTLVPVAVPGAALMILGDIPDSDEDRTGVLFAGAPGALLTRMLGSIGLAPDALSRAAAIPWRPPGERDVTDAEREACVPLLQQAIALCAPKIVAGFGPTSARMLMGADTQLNRVRGRWVTLNLPQAPHPIRFLPMRHPAQVAASPQARKDAWRDLLALAEALEEAGP
ncbi:uracil-DNA glycosylase [Tanticharoenia sakaeratensis]|uniref:Bacteriophage-type DNA polymerase n=1 Tax=Tanticharoenia sakaeratensis NBRC 103193 TaxID=1231623 RepID=A0A0D6MLP2_9PROT|nr:uracil-DNA glycosylase [Tanticharoenia sakaeratensis]GAN54592.1 bacteriophage-type DNA polymerase [Tanticharoenia sakaeratensis NBRC 103193]GBQ22943.1 bacteriophage-type DNA polymerase [Tanticharoenia sakaeratensis NBRC 103193]